MLWFLACLLTFQSSAENNEAIFVYAEIKKLLIILAVKLYGEIRDEEFEITWIQIGFPIAISCVHSILQ